jgi:hypothetical protein
MSSLICRGFFVCLDTNSQSKSIAIHTINQKGRRMKQPQVEHFRPGAELRARLDNFAIPRGMSRHAALRVLIAASLEVVERGGTISLVDPLRHSQRQESHSAA